jgi:hypothetical protein
MTQVLTPSDEEITDFTEYVHVKFRIDNDVFNGVSNIPAMSLIEFATMFDGMSENDLISDPKAFDRMFHLVLEDESANRFFFRMGDKKEPISMTQVMRIMPWIMEKYGMRPTEPSSNSSDGSANPDDGMSSTVNAQLTAQTSATSQPIAS